MPTILNYLSKDKIEIKDTNKSVITNFFANTSINNSTTIFSITSLIIILSVFGINKLEVENSFINYFKKNTEIYKGMKLIDDKLGGTTPLEIILKFPEKKKKLKKMMILMIGKKMKIPTMKNTGLLKTKLIKLKKFITILRV